MDNTELKLTSILKQLLATIVSMVSNICNIATLELRLAIKSLLVISLLIILAVFLLLCTWLFLLAAAAVWLTTLHLSWPISLLIVAGSNLLLIVVILSIVINYRKYFQFKSTRHQLATYGKTHEKFFDERAAKANKPA
jgi:uncharacterized membrane protein YqjE